MAKLRPYQIAQIDGVMSAWSDGARSVMMQLPTGGGKTLMAAEIAKRHRTERKGAVTVITHRRELEAQTAAAFVEYGLPKTLITAVSPIRALNQDLASAAGENDLLVVDEAHHATARTWAANIQRWRGRVLGLTATPWRLSLKEGYTHLFDVLVSGAQPSKLTDDGYLAPVRTLLATERIIGGRTNPTGDYSAADTMKRNSHRVLVENAIDWLSELNLTDKPTIAYCIGVEHARGVAKAAAAAGIPAGVILGAAAQTSSERDDTLARFERGEITLLANVEVATEGFDLPDAEVCLMLRPTESLALYLQMVGRVRRPKPDKTAWLLDSTENTEKHGLPNDEREWSLKARNPKDGVAPIKDCPGCGNVDAMGAHRCDSRCGWEYGRKCAASPYGCGEWRAWRHWTESRSAMRCQLCVVNEAVWKTQESGVLHSAWAEANELRGALSEAATETAGVHSENDVLRSENNALHAENESLRLRLEQAKAAQQQATERERQDDHAHAQAGVQTAVWTPVNGNHERETAVINGFRTTIMPDQFNKGRFGFMAFGEGGVQIAKRFRLPSLDDAKAAAIKACREHSQQA